LLGTHNSVYSEEQEENLNINEFS